MAEYIEAGERVKKLASDLIDQYHKHLGSARIAFVFRDKAMKSKGKKVAAKTSKLGKKNKKLTALGTDHEGFDFVIEIAEPWWSGATERMQKALLDHELSHCVLKEDGKWGTVSHDFEGFRDVVDRWGFWCGDLKQFKSRLQQMELPIAKRFNEQDNDRGKLEVVKAAN